MKKNYEYRLSIEEHKKTYAEESRTIVGRIEVLENGEPNGIAADLFTAYFENDSGKIYEIRYEDSMVVPISNEEFETVAESFEYTEDGSVSMKGRWIGLRNQGEQNYYSMHDQYGRLKEYTAFVGAAGGSELTRKLEYVYDEKDCLSKIYLYYNEDVESVIGFFDGLE